MEIKQKLKMRSSKIIIKYRLPSVNPDVLSVRRSSIMARTDNMMIALVAGF